MKQLKELILFAVAIGLIWVCRAIDLNWNVETTRIQPAVFEAYHGETLDLEASLLKNGKPLADALQGEWKIYWQTNGMDQAWWSAPVSAPIGNKVSATFTGEMDPGSNVVNGFIGCAGENYRAAFIIRFRHSPGSTPNTLLKPVPILDLANTTVINAPWPTDETIAATVRRVIEEDGITGSGGSVEGALRKDDIYKIGVHYSGPEEGAVADAYTTWSAIHANGNAYKNLSGDVTALGSRVTTVEGEAETAKTRATQAGVQATLAGQTAQAVYAYMAGNSTNAWFAATNYVTNAEIAATRHKFAFEDGMDLSTVPSSMALYEIRDGAKVCVWDQRDWTSYYFEFKKRQIQDEINNLCTNKADRAWSHHTATGIDNPAEDTVWLDTPKVVLSAGYAWQRNITTSGNSFFTLVSNGLWSFGNSAKGSSFEIKDFEGNSLFKVSKTDSYLADVAPQNVVTDGDDLLLRCLFDPEDAIDKTDLTVYGCNDLVTESWTDLSTVDAPGTVSFTGGISDWTLRITPKNPQGKFFVFVKVRVEGQTKNEFAAPVEFQKIVINNIVYTVGTATINGQTVLTLTR